MTPNPDTPTHEQIARIEWSYAGVNGYRQFATGYGDRTPLQIKVADVTGGRIYRFEDEVDIASGHGGTLKVVRVSYLFAPATPEVPNE